MAEAVGEAGEVAAAAAPALRADFKSGPDFKTGTGFAAGESRYTPAVGAAICARVAAGESLSAVCREAAMPAYGTVWRWARRHEDFAAQLAAAQGAARRAVRARQANVLAQAMARFAPLGRTGRPCGYSQALAQAVCLRIAHGEGLSSICADPEMPCVATLFGWLRRYRAFEEMYVRARAMQAHLKFDLAWEVACAATPENAQVSRLQVAVIRWHAAKLAPKVFAENLPVPEEPLTVHVRTWGENGWCDQETPEPPRGDGPWD